MKKLILGLFLSFIAFNVQAQTIRGSGNIETQDRNIGNFSAISVQGGIDLYLKQGSKNELTVKADEKIIDYVITEIKNNTLVIRMKEKIRYSSRSSEKVYVVFKDIEKLSSSGGSDVETEALDLDELSIRSSGGSDIDIQIDAKRLDISTSGGSDIFAKGSTNILNVRSSGGSDFDGKELKAKECEIIASGGADAYVYATEKLSMNASGASDITYKGGAEVVSSRSSGAADIRKNK